MVNNEWNYISAAAYAFLVSTGKNLLILYLKPSVILEFNFLLLPRMDEFRIYITLPFIYEYMVQQGQKHGKNATSAQAQRLTLKS
jgi:hypothetical protein